MAQCFIGLGGNTGDVLSCFDKCLEQLNRGVTEVVSRSSPYRTRPVGHNAGSTYCNAAAKIRTTLDPDRLLQLMLAIESEHGRSRSVRWGPRPIDLDLLLYDDVCLDVLGLHIPHRALWYRRFVLDPLVEIGGDILHPEKQMTVARLRQRLLPRPLIVRIAGGSPQARKTIIASLAAGCAEADVAEWHEDDDEPALLPWLGGQQPGDVSPFQRLPPVPRLDASEAEEPAEFLCWVVRSALG